MRQMLVLLSELEAWASAEGSSRYYACSQFDLMARCIASPPKESLLISSCELMPDAVDTYPFCKITVLL